MTPERLQQVLANGALLLDVRSPEEYAAGHLAGAINCPHTTLDEAELPSDRSKEILVYCQMGGRAEQAKEMLEILGYQSVTNLGGIVDLVQTEHDLAQD